MAPGGRLTTWEVVSPHSGLVGLQVERPRYVFIVLQLPLRPGLLLATLLPSLGKALVLADCHAHYSPKSARGLSLCKEGRTACPVAQQLVHQRPSLLGWRPSLLG